MASFSKLLSSVLIAILYASTANAMPWPATSKHATHRMHNFGADGSLKLETFHPESTFEGFGVEGLDHPLSRRAGDFDIESASVSFLASRLGIHEDDIHFRTSAKAEVAHHAFMKQQINGVPVANAVANVAFNDDGKVLSFGSSFVKPLVTADKTPTVSLSDAIVTAQKALDGTHNGHPATLEYLIQADGSAALTHVIQIQNEDAGTWMEAFVDAHSNKVLSVTDFVAKASYLALPINRQVPAQGFQTLVDPQDLTASPFGWHSDGTTSTTVTAGNNVIAFKGTQLGTTPQTSPALNFIYPQNTAQLPTTLANINAAITNTFYVANSVHDFTYKYGFTESTFNFQTNNFRRGALGNDRVTVSVQDAAGVNNADFATPPDGQSGAMRMFLWSYTNPQRDVSFENDIVIHEYTHGVTNRMTGGGTGRCLQVLEGNGLGEGWSDAMADWAAQGSTTVDFVVGQYVVNKPLGFRTYPYSTSAATNPLRYSNLRTLNEPHAIGEVWANILHNVYASLVTTYGWSATARTNPAGREGNVVHLHLFLDALLLQPCNPTFITARNAWMQADANRYAGANTCLLWRAFASRGLGFNAANYVDDFSVPRGC